MKKPRAIGSHESRRAKTTDWLTPPSIIAALGGASSFDLDPATPELQPWPTARARFTKADDGLAQPWFGRVWLNPPYGDELARWLKRLADHGRGTTLIFARTETEAFFDSVWRSASGLLFLHGRLHFHYPNGRRARSGGGAPSVLCAYGPEDLDILSDCGLAGHFVPLRLPRGYVVAALDLSWRQALVDWVKAHDEPVALDDLYRAFADHPKARRNQHYRAKIRQVLQHGPFRRIARGLWRAEVTA